MEFRSLREFRYWWSYYGNKLFYIPKRMKAMNNWSGDSDNEEYGPSNSTVYWSTNGYYSKSIGNRTDICGNVGIQNCYVILAYDVGETFTDNASNTLQQEDLSKPFGDISKNIITNPRYMVGANIWIYGVPSSASQSECYPFSRTGNGTWWRYSQFSTTQFRWQQASANMYKYSSAHDGLSLISGFTSSPWINYTDISSNPNLSLNEVVYNPTISSIRTIYLDYTDNYQNDMRPYLLSLNEGTSSVKALFYIINSQNKEDFAIFRWKNLIDNVTYGTIEADYLSDSSNNTLELIDSNSYKIQFHKNGDRGSRGYQGLMDARISGNTRFFWRSII